SRSTAGRRTYAVSTDCLLACPKKRAPRCLTRWLNRSLRIAEAHDFRAICRPSPETARLFEHVRLFRSPVCLRSRTLLSTTAREPMARDRRDAGFGRALPRLE